MRREAAVDVVAREDLRRADTALAAPARIARAAWHHGRNDHALADESGAGGACALDDAADLVAERQRQVGRALTPEEHKRLFDSAASNPEWEHVY